MSMVGWCLPWVWLLSKVARISFVGISYLQSSQCILSMNLTHLITKMLQKGDQNVTQTRVSSQHQSLAKKWLSKQGSKILNETNLASKIQMNDVNTGMGNASNFFPLLFYRALCPGKFIYLHVHWRWTGTRLGHMHEPLVKVVTKEQS